MQYQNLNELINKSSSSRRYFISLPVSVQIKLHELNSFIHTAYQLRKNAEYIAQSKTDSI